MKVKFECKECKAENEFDTKGQTQRLLESKTEVKETKYIVECKACGAENLVRVLI